MNFDFDWGMELDKIAGKRGQESGYLSGSALAATFARHYLTLLYVLSFSAVHPFYLAFGCKVPVRRDQS